MSPNKMLMFLTAGICFAGQSILLTSGSSASGTSAAVSGPNYEEFYIDSGPSTISATQNILQGASSLQVTMYQGGASTPRLQAYYTNETGTGGTECLYTGVPPYYVRMTHDPAGVYGTASTDYCQVFNTSGVLVYQNATTYTTVGSPFSGATFSGGTAPFTIAFYRLCTGTLPGLRARVPTTAGSGVAEGCPTGTDALAYKFDGNLVEANGNSAYNLTLTGSASYPTTADQNIIAVSKIYGQPSWSNPAGAPVAVLPFAMRAGTQSQLDASSSVSQGDVTNIITASWSCSSCPAYQWISAQNAVQPFFLPLLVGDYQITLTASATGLPPVTVTQDFGSVSEDTNGDIVNSDPRIDWIFGPQIAYGKHPWGYVDFSQQLYTQYWGQNYSVNGGAWDLETDLTTVSGVPRNGTVYVTNGSIDVYGVGTNFGAVYCGGTAPCTPACCVYVAPHVPAGTNVPYFNYPRLVGSVLSDTHLQLVSGWSWDAQATISSPGVAWGTYGLCSTCGNWAGANSTTSNLNYYDNGAAHYQFAARSGLSYPKTAGEWVADRWIHAPLVSYGSPRDLELLSVIYRATFDPPSTTQLWPAIRTALSVLCPAPGYWVGNPISDLREGGWCLEWWAAAALLDTGSGQTTAQNWLATTYTSTWGPEPSGNQQTNGQYINNEVGSDPVYSFTATNGSPVMTINTGVTVPSTYCGESSIITQTGTISIASDNLTINGVGTSFSTAGVGPGYAILMTGTKASVPWSMVGVVASVTSNAQLIMSTPWRGDATPTITAWRIYNYNATPFSGYLMQAFQQVSSANVLPNPNIPDTDNWYFCKVTSSTQITLDKPYTGNTASGNIYRSIYAFNLPGRGTEPFMQAIITNGMYLASKALATANPTLSAQYLSAANLSAEWLYNFARDSVSNGAWYGVTFSNCQNLQYPSDSCSGSYIAQSRDFAMEIMGPVAQCIMSGTCSVTASQLKSWFTALYAAPGYTSPIAGDGNYVDALVCCSGYTYTKYWGQVYTVGQANSVPVMLNGGIVVAIPRTFTMTFWMPTGATSAIVTSRQPNGLTTTTTCTGTGGTLTTCSVPGWDARQGSYHTFQIVYNNGLSSDWQTAQVF